MTEPKRALTDLRSVAEQQLFADFRVTPELKAKLQQRIERSAAPVRAGRRPEQRPWLRWGGGLAVAAAAVVALALFGGQPRHGQEQWKQATPAAAPAPGRGNPVVTAANASGERLGSTVAPPVTQPTSMKDAYIISNTSNKVAVVASPTVAYTTSTQAISVGSQSTSAGPSVEAQPGRKIILNAEYQIQVKDAVTAMQRFQTLAATTAGYVVDAALNKGSDDSWTGRLTLRLPSGLYNSAITEIRQIGDVKQERQWSQDVTERYYDLQARIQIQQEYERKLQELATKATTFDDWMKLTQQVNETRALIEQMQGSIKLLANQVEYSTINISFYQPAPDQVPPPKPPEPAKGLWPNMVRSFRASVQWFADLGQAVLVGVAGFTPFLVALGALALAGFGVWRRLRHRPPVA